MKRLLLCVFIVCLSCPCQVEPNPDDPLPTESPAPTPDPTATPIPFPTPEDTRAWQAITNLDLYFQNNKGYPPNAIQSFQINGNTATALYHIFENEPSHLKNGAATTSESQELFFNYLALRNLFANNSNALHPDEAYFYIRYYMMPHDGYESPQLPDNLLIDYAYHHRLLHWLIQVENRDTNGLPPAGDKIFLQPNTLYKIYDPGFELYKTSAIACGADGLPDEDATWPNDNNTFKFGAALDADQWIISGYLFRAYNDSSFISDIEKTKKSLMSCLAKTGTYPLVMQFGRYWGGNFKEGWLWLADDRNLYTGYQDPAAFYIAKETFVAEQIVHFLKEAQTAFFSNYGNNGPFMPNYNATDQAFSWIGPDKNTHLMLFQYRALAHLAMYYYLSDNTEAAGILQTALEFIHTHSDYSNESIAIPFSLFSGTTGSDGVWHNVGATGSVEFHYYSAGNFGLYLQVLSLMAMATGDGKYKTRADLVMQRLLENQDGKGCFPQDNMAYGFDQAEVGIGLLLYCCLQNNNLMQEIKNFLATDIFREIEQLLFTVNDLNIYVTNGTDQAISTNIIGNNEFELVEEKIYAYGGATVTVNEEAKSLTLQWDGAEWQGAIHEYDGTEWNGVPKPLNEYAYLYLYVEMIAGSSANLKLEINDIPIFDLNFVRDGMNIIDLDILANRPVDPIIKIDKLNILGAQGSSGRARIKIILQHKPDI